ncbi:9010_t:CDS:10, partial [Funneliformis mosseae]
MIREREDTSIESQIEEYSKGKSQNEIGMPSHELISNLEEALSCIPPPITYSPDCITSKITTKASGDPPASVKLWEDFFEEVNRFRFDQQPIFERLRFNDEFNDVVDEEDVCNAIKVNICQILNKLMGPDCVYSRKSTDTHGISDFNCHLTSKGKDVVQQIYNYIGGNELRYVVSVQGDNDSRTLRSHSKSSSNSSLNQKAFSSSLNNQSSSTSANQQSSPVDQQDYSFTDFKFKGILGEGRSSKTLLCEFCDDTIVLKSVNLSKAPLYVLKEMQKEVEMYKDLANIQGKYIPKLVYYGYYGGGMSFVIGLTIVSTMLSDQKITEQQKSRAIKRLEAIHKHGILHNDIRKENILINDKGALYLIDFRMASQEDTKKKRKLFDEEQLKLSQFLDGYIVTGNNISAPSSIENNLSCDMKMITCTNSENASSDEMSGPIATQPLDRNQVTEQTLKHELSRPISSVESVKLHDESILNNAIEDSMQRLAYWIDEEAMKIGLKEILCLYHYSFEFEEKLMSKKYTDKYFDRKASEWNILDFLNECEAEQFDLKIHRYIKSLEKIASDSERESDCRSETAQILLDNYRKASGFVGCLSLKIPPGRRWLCRLSAVQRLIADLAGWETGRAWDSGRSYNQIHCHQPTIMNGGIINGFINGTMAGGTLTAESSNKRDQEKEDEQKQTKRVRFHEEKPPSKKKSKSGKRGDTLPDGTKITKPSPINYAQTDEGDETGDGIPSNEANDYSDEDEEALPPEDSLAFALSSSKVWTLPSGKNVGDIYSEKISENARTVKNKKRLTAIEKAILRYGASRIIDLSAHMKKWFCENDKKFIKKDYESMLRVPEMTGEESSFVLKVEDHLQEQRQEDILDFTTKGAHTEVDVILKACAYIVEGLNKSLTIYPRWGESFCPLSRSADHINGRKCD